MLTKSEIAFIRSLSSKKERTAAGLFVAEGDKLVREILSSPLTVDRLLIREQKGLSSAGGIKAEIVSAKEMERISLLKTPTDVLALVNIPHYTLPAHLGVDSLVIALDDVQDPGNMGTIIRLADWFGIRDIICSEHTADCFNPKVIQATMGAIIRTRIHYLCLPDFLEKTQNIPLYGTFLNGDDLYETPLTRHGILIMGSEGHGISDAVEQRITRRIYIPPYPAAAPTSESLNVAVATAIACAEFRRRIR